MNLYLSDLRYTAACYQAIVVLLSSAILTKGQQPWQDVQKKDNQEDAGEHPQGGTHVRDGEWSGHRAVGMEPGRGASCYCLPMFGEEVMVLSSTLQKCLLHQGMETLNLSPLHSV